MTETALDVKREEVSITANDVKKYICPKATDKEIELFLITCKLHNLNPLKREAYLIKYGTDPAQTVVGYETYLKRAEATGQLDGWKCRIEGDKAKIVIYRKDRQFPFEWEADGKEFNKGIAMWKKIPNHMLKKTVISMGFRLAFPETLGGMPYTKEEMADAEEIEYTEIPINEEEVETRQEPDETPPPDLGKPEPVKVDVEIKDIPNMRKTMREQVMEMKGGAEGASYLEEKCKEVFSSSFVFTSTAALHEKDVEPLARAVEKDYNKWTKEQIKKEESDGVA